MNFILISRFWILWILRLFCFSAYCLCIFANFAKLFLCIFNLKVRIIFGIFMVMRAIFLLILWWFSWILRSFSFGFYEVFIWAFPYGRAIEATAKSFHSSIPNANKKSSGESLGWQKPPAMIARGFCQPLLLPPLPQALNFPNVFLKGNYVEIVATISSFYLILLSVAIEVFFSANVLHLANFTSPHTVFRWVCCSRA